MSIFVYNNPNNIDYNSYLLMFVRSWYLPTQKGEPPLNDSWLRVPALKTQRFNNASYTCCNGNLELISVMTIAEDTCKLTKVARGNSGFIIDYRLVEDIIKESTDISEYEKIGQKSWPYELMFDKNLIQYRYYQKYGDDRAKYMDPTSNNIPFMEIRKIVTPRPCSGCGKRRA